MATTLFYFKFFICFVKKYNLKMYGKYKCQIGK